MIELYKISSYKTYGINYQNVSTTLDSGIPIEEKYTLEEILPYLGKRVLIRFTDIDKIENKIILNIKGIIVSRRDNDFLLLSETEYKNRLVIPISTINHIQIIEDEHGR